MTLLEQAQALAPQLRAMKDDLHRHPELSFQEKRTTGILREKLTALGLNERERNEFIVYWLPRMQDNEYNLIAFQGEEYTEHARLKISPEPDSILRVFMAYQTLDEPVDVPEQELEPFVREGFTVVEWGGTEME